MGIRASYLAAAVSLAFAASANAGLVGSTYDFSTSVTGNTAIGATAGTYTAATAPEDNPFFCVGPPVLCDQGSGLSGLFAFADVSSTQATIEFRFFGSTFGAGPGTFVIELGNFATLDGSTVTNITYDSGNLFQGDFTDVSWDGTTAIFTGSTDSDYNGSGGAFVTFNVTVAPAAVPEPGSLALLGIALLGFGATRWRHNRV